MRILYHHRTLGDGAEGIHIAEMVGAFRNLGHEVLLVGPNVRKNGSEQKRSGIFSEVKRFIKGPAYELLEIGYNAYGFNVLCKAIEKFKPSLVYDRYITFNYSCIAAAQKKNIPMFLEVNAPLAYERDHEADESLYFRKIAYEVEKRTCSNANRTIVVSSPLRDYLVSIGVPLNKICVLPNGVNTEKFYPKPKSRELMHSLGITDSSIVLGFVGILRPWHGVDLLLESFRSVYAEFPNTILLLVGDGPIRTRIETLAHELGVGRSLRITGRVPHDKVSDYVALMDVAISPKATFYASPMKIIEYMAQGKTVVAPAMGNIKDILDDSVSGLLFLADSAESLAATLRVAIADRYLRFRIGESALSETRKNLNWKANATRIVNEYKILSGT